MKAFRVVAVCAVLILTLASRARANGQVDPEAGRSLSAQLAAEEQVFQALVSQNKAFGLGGKGSSYEFLLVSRNMVECDSLIRSARAEIYALNYENARRILARFQVVSQATKTMFDEDALIPPPEFRRESVIDDGDAPAESLPDLKGPVLRAAIGSEISFSERLIRRAGVNTDGFVVATFPNGRRTTCSDAQDKFTLEAIAAEKRLDYFARYQRASPDTYFSMANAELRLLHYSTAHELAYTALSIGQTILSVCSAAPR